MPQSTLVRKLCTLSRHNRTRKAIFGFDKPVRSIHTPDYLRDPQMRRDVHRSQNRIEAYHQLRSSIAQAGGKKQLIGGTGLDAVIGNQCGRLIANVVAAYNSIMLSMSLERYRAEDNQKALASLRKISPVAWQHIHLPGHHTFRGNTHPIGLNALLANIVLVWAIVF